MLCDEHRILHERQLVLHMNQPESTSPLRHWKQDFLASIVVFFVALPLCMGIALASGAPVAAGLITGIVGGIVAGSLAGCPLQVSGPAAGLTVIVYEIIQRLGLEMLGLAVLVAGVMQIVAGGLKLGPWFRAVSPAVIHGMLAGIGVLIFASQFHVMVDDKPRSSGLENLMTHSRGDLQGVGVPTLAGEPEREFRTARAAADGRPPARPGQHARPRRGADSLRTHDAGVAGAGRRRRAGTGRRSFRSRSASPALLKILSDELARRRSRSRKAHVHLDRPKAALGEAIASSQAAEAALQSGKAVDASDARSGGGGDRRRRRAAEESSARREARHPHDRDHLLWQKFAPKQLRLVPAPLVAIVAATLARRFFVLPVFYVEIPGSLVDEIHLPTLTLLKNAPWGEILQTAAVDRDRRQRRNAALRHGRRPDCRRAAAPTTTASWPPKASAT